MPPAGIGGACWSFREEAVSIDSLQFAQFTRLNDALSLLGPGLGDIAEHVAPNASFFHCGYRLIRGGKKRRHRLVDIDMFSGSGALGDNSASALRFRTDRDSMNI